MWKLEMGNCEVLSAGKNRNGTNRWWCRTHQASATGQGGNRLEVCTRYETYQAPQKCIVIDPGDYPGGVGIWAAVPPVLDTRSSVTIANYVECPGVHLHARTHEGGAKDFDDTFDQISVSRKSDIIDSSFINIDKDLAISFLISKEAGVNLASEVCSHCGYYHLDKDEYATFNHKKHLCENCGRFFLGASPSVSNPILHLIFAHQSSLHDRRIVRAQNSLSINQADYPGGVEVWASNSALFWTANRPEEAGVHIHAYDEFGARVVDETFDEVMIDGLRIDEGQLRKLMVQQAIPAVRRALRFALCAECGSALNSVGSSAFVPSSAVVCYQCGEVGEPMHSSKAIYNPILEVIRVLEGGGE